MRTSRTPFVLLVYHFIPKSDQYQISPQPHLEYNITQYEELDFSQLTQMKDDYTTNSHYLIYISLLRKDGRMSSLNMGVKELMRKR